MTKGQIEGLAEVITSHPDLWAILKGGKKDVDDKLQEGVSQSVQSGCKREAPVVGGSDKK